MVLCFLWLTPGARSASALVHTFTPISSVWQCKVVFYLVHVHLNTRCTVLLGALSSDVSNDRPSPSLTLVVSKRWVSIAMCGIARCSKPPCCCGRTAFAASGATEPQRLPTCTVSTPTLCAATTHTITMAAAYLYASPVDTPLLTVTCGGACMRVEHGAVFEVRCNPIQHYGGLPMHRHDVQARGGGGAAESLHASCRSLGAVPEVEGLERGQAAQCSHPYVRHVDAVVEAETRECRQVAHCPHALVCHRAAKEEVERVQSGCSQLAAPTSVTAT